MVQIPGPRLKVGENPQGLPRGGCWCLELTDALQAEDSRFRCQIFHCVAYFLKI